MAEEVTNDGRGWRNAVKRFVEEDKTYGDILTHQWLYESFEIEQPTDETPSGQADKLRLQALAQRERFRSELLNEFQMDIQSEPKMGGYLVVHPKDQTRRAMNDFHHEIKRALRQTASRLSNVDHTLLGARERQENVDEIARLSKLRGMVRTQFPKLSAPTAEED